MAEGVRRPAFDDSRAEKMREVAIPGNLPETDDNPDPRQERELLREVRGTFADLGGCRLVAWRSAANDCADPHAPQTEAIADVGGVWLIGETGIMQDGIKKITRAVPGKDPAGAVATVSTGREAEGQDAGARVAEARNGPGPVGLVDVGAAFALANALAVVAKPWTPLTCSNLLMESCKGYEGLRAGLLYSNRI